MCTKKWIPNTGEALHIQTLEIGGKQFGENKGGLEDWLYHLAAIITKSTETESILAIAWGWG